MFSILKDIRSGALPANQIPGFIAYLLRKAFYPLIAFVIVAGGTLLLLK